MNTKSLLAWVLLLAGYTSCRPDQQENEVLTQANQLHIEAVNTAEQVEQKIDSLRKIKADQALQIKLDSIAQLVELWEEGLIEVPGFAHEHHGPHEHKPAPQMTAQSMLEYQQQANEAIRLIRSQVDELSNEK